MHVCVWMCADNYQFLVWIDNWQFSTSLDNESYSVQFYSIPWSIRGSFFNLYGILVSLRVAVVGNVDAGKSTLLGVLTHGELDNGRGFARQKLFRHKHEMESGRTSSVGNDILGFDQEGQVSVYAQCFTSKRSATLKMTHVFNDGSYIEPWGAEICWLLK